MPTGTPADIIQKLNAEVNKALAHPDVRSRLAAQGADILGGSPADYAAYLRTEIPRWAKAVKDSGAKAEKSALRSAQALAGSTVGGARMLKRFNRFSIPTRFAQDLLTVLAQAGGRFLLRQMGRS